MKYICRPTNKYSTDDNYHDFSNLFFYWKKDLKYIYRTTTDNIEIYIKWDQFDSKLFKIYLNIFNKNLSADNYEFQRKTKIKAFKK